MGKKRCFIIGLDGTPFSFLKKEIAAGHLPNLASLSSDGSFNVMETEIPTISSVAWASFMTGKNPGEHGIFGFTDRKSGTYDLYFPNYSHLRSEPMWDALNKSGKRCCVLNVPSTYPARPMNGVMVSGFVAPSLERATYPDSALEFLQASNYRIDVDASKGRESLDALLEDLFLTLEKRREAFLHFMGQEEWDLFVGVFTGTDRLHHFFWKQYEENDATYYPAFMSFYKRVDEIVGEMVAEMPSGSALLMLSDHGSTTIKNEIYINAYLHACGYLEFVKESPMTIADIDGSRTKAYCMDPGRIYLNLQGREPAGIIPKAKYYDTLNELKNIFQDLKDPQSGDTVIEKIFFKDDIYHGKVLDRAPDMIVQPMRGYDFKGAVGQKNIFWQGHLTGMHTQDDAFVFINHELTDEPPSHIRDVARPVMDYLLD